MKPSKLIPTIIALAAGLSGANAAQLFTNGNMETFNGSGVPNGWYATGSNVTPSQSTTNSPFTNAYAPNTSSFNVIETGGSSDGFAQSFSSTTNYQTVTVNLDFMVPTLTASQVNGTWGIQFDGDGGPSKPQAASSSVHYRIDLNGNFSIVNNAGTTNIVSLDAGSWYNIQATFIVTANNTTGNNGAGYQFGSITKSGGDTTSWNNVALLNTTQGYSRLLVRDRSAAQSGGLLIDNVSVVNAIPEPSSALLLLGGSLLAFRRRRASI
jgi:hypothetical protein